MGGGDTSVPPQDAMRSVTKQAVKEARLREIKDELLNSEKLKVNPLPPAPRAGARGGPRGVRVLPPPPPTFAPPPPGVF